MRFTLAMLKDYGAEFESVAFFEDATVLKAIPLEFEYYMSTGNIATKSFLIKCWHKKGNRIQEPGFWFDMTFLYSHLARWLSNNHPNEALRSFWKPPKGWLSCTVTRHRLIDAIRASNIPDAANRILFKDHPYMSYKKLADLIPEFFAVTGQARNITLYGHQSMVSSFFFPWLEEKTFYPFFSWFNETLYELNQQQTDEGDTF